MSTVPANTVQTFAQVGIREDLSDIITNIAPTETPVYSMARKGRAQNRKPEWQNDTLQAADETNAAVEGDDVAGEAMVQPARIDNITQIYDKTVIVSTTAQAVDTAGRASELRFQVAKSGKEMKRDIEKRISGNYGTQTGDGSTTPNLHAGLMAYCTTNLTVGGTGSAGGWQSSGSVTAHTEGTDVAYTLDRLNAIVKGAWENGGDPGVVVVDGTVKGYISTYTDSNGRNGISTQYKENTGRSLSRAVILGSADWWVSDFGEHRIIPSRFAHAKSAFVLDPRLIEVAFLQPFSTKPLARTGHSDKRLLACELTAKMLDERGCGALMAIDAPA